LALKIALAAIMPVLAVVSPVFGQPSHAKVAILTPGMTLAPVHEGLKEGLARLGYKEGQNTIFIVEDTKGSTADLSHRTAKLLAAKPDVLFTVTTTHSIAAKQATATLPIVFAWVGNPAEAGLIAGYASSQNNLTGVSSLNAPLSSKRLDVLMEIAPKIKRILTVLAIDESIALSSFRYLEETAKKMRVQLVRRDIKNEEEIERTLREIPKGGADAIYYIPAVMMRNKIDLLIKKAKTEKIPLIVQDDSLVEQGALISYGPKPRLIGLQSAPFVDKVLKGAKPSDIVVEIPNKLHLVVNLTTAKEIGLKIPRDILERADRLVE